MFEEYLQELNNILNVAGGEKGIIIELDKDNLMLIGLVIAIAVFVGVALANALPNLL